MNYRRHPALRTVLLAVGLSAAGGALALPPDEIFERTGPTVWALRALDADEKPLASASAVVIGPGRVVTSCQVLARARKVELRRANAIFEAKLEFPDVERDLCQLRADGLSAPAAAPGSARTLRPGKRIYVIGYTRGTEQSIADGLVAAVRDAGTHNERVQTSVPAARGLLGAGLFDEDARLVGIVTASAKDAPNAAFALPADWLAEVPARGAATLAKRAAPAAAASGGAPGMPAPGATWRYQYVDHKYQRTLQQFTVQATKAAGTTVEDSLAASGLDAQVATFQGPEAGFLQRRLAAGQSLLELSPYLLAANKDAAHSGFGKPKGYPNSYLLVDWSVAVSAPDWETITVQAGTYKALRVTVKGQRSISDVARRWVEPSLFEYVIWYVPEIGRYARIRHKAETASGPVADEAIELLEYKPG
jgi:hypothetical protein